MILTWLPYVAEHDGSQPGLTWRSSPPARPPAPSLRPAVAIPLALFASLLCAAAWAGTSSVPAPAAAGIEGPLAPLAAVIPPPFDLVEPVAAWAPDIQRWAAAYDLPVELVAVVMTLESCGDPSARSRAGALGLFQVMPFHFKPGEDPLDPEVNARRGLSYLRRSLELAAGDAGLALAGYNGGHGLILRDPALWPAETVRYVRWASGILGDLQSAAGQSATLQAWFDAGGEHLCRRAADRLS